MTNVRKRGRMRLSLAGSGLFVTLVACGGGAAERAPQRPITIERAVAPAPIVTGEAASAAIAVYLTIHNDTPAPDTLVAAVSPGARSVSLHEEMKQGGSMMAAIVLPVASITDTALGVGEQIREWRWTFRILAGQVTAGPAARDPRARTVSP